MPEKLVSFRVRDALHPNPHHEVFPASGEKPNQRQPASLPHQALGHPWPINSRGMPAATSRDKGPSSGLHALPEPVLRAESDAVADPSVRCLAGAVPYLVPASLRGYLPDSPPRAGLNCGARQPRRGQGRFRTSCRPLHRGRLVRSPGAIPWVSFSFAVGRRSPPAGTPAAHQVVPRGSDGYLRAASSRNDPRQLADVAPHATVCVAHSHAGHNARRHSSSGLWCVVGC